MMLIFALFIIVRGEIFKPSEMEMLRSEVKSLEALPTTGKDERRLMAIVAPKVFSLYEKAFDRVYETNEKYQRFKIFVKNLKEFQRTGKRPSTWKKGVNLFTDRTQEERKSFLGYNRTRAPHKQRPEIDALEIDPRLLSNNPNFGFPLYLHEDKGVDWRGRGAVTTPLNQHQCGVCWSFAGVGAIESLYYIKTGVLLDMSVQQVIDCTYNDGGCQGGWFGDVWGQIRTQNKIAAQQQYPLDFKHRQCDYNKIRRSEDSLFAARLGSTHSARENNEEEILNALMRNPVSAGMHVVDELYSYSSGIYQNEDCPQKENNHAVLIVGYDKMSYIIKNSWGEKWGEKGFFKMLRSFTCGIASDVAWPTMYTYHDKDPKSPELVCKDKYSWCKSWSENWCPRSKKFRKYCPYSCSVCSCRNVWKKCEEKRGQCSKKQKVRDMCKVTCGTCTCPPGTSLCGTRCRPYWDPLRTPRRCEEASTDWEEN